MKLTSYYPKNIALRKRLYDWYASPKGFKLRSLEAKYLARAIDVSYRQTILQIGASGWEDLFIDVGYFQNYFVVDQVFYGDVKAKNVYANFRELPFPGESVDLVIMPHSLEFETDRHQVLREVERVLKSEGKLLYLGFHPWSASRFFRGLPTRHNPLTLPWSGRFISRFRVQDWLSLLNFEVELSICFFFNSSRVVNHRFGIGISDFLAVSYAITAIKRRYHVIPIKPAIAVRRRFAVVEVVEPTYHANVGNETN